MPGQPTGVVSGRRAARRSRREACRARGSGEVNMRVLRLCSVFEPPASALAAESAAAFDPIGGMQNHTGHLSRALDALGIAQTVITSRPPTAPAVAPLGRHGRVIRLGLPIGVFRQCYSLYAWWRLPCLAPGADVIHAHLGEDLAIVPLALRAARLSGAPIVLTVHCSLRHTLRVTGPRSLLLKTLGGALEGYGVDRAAAVIALTDRLRRELARPDVHVIPSGVGGEFRADPADLGPGLPAGLPRPRIAYVGRLHPQKGVDTLLRGFALFSAAAPGHLVLVGDGPERARLRRLAARLGVERRTLFLGFLPHERIPAVLRDVDVLVLPSRYEELGSVLVEAMYSGVPVVASATGGVPELVRHRESGLLVPPGSPYAIAEALRELTAHPALAAALASRARRQAAELTWDTLVHRVVDVYRSVLARRRRGRAYPAHAT
ncbi:glycosyltransferase [Microtetraspora malaysiensis]|uniref:glycosyltransferase n=1 Tax=Microtetraspora malaysiensis TaxID=161358 RepID=UPI003D89FD38